MGVEEGTSVEDAVEETDGGWAEDDMVGIPAICCVGAVAVCQAGRRGNTYNLNG